MTSKGADDRGLSVCVVSSSFHPLIGGAERVTNALCRQLVAEGAEVVVLTRRYPGLSAQTQLGGVIVYRAGHPSRSKIGAISFLAHGMWIYFTRLRRFRVVHAHSPDVPLLLGFMLKVLAGVSLILTVHSDPRVLFSLRRLGPIRLYLTRQLVSAVVVQDQEKKRELVAMGLQEPHVHVIPNGVDAATFSPADEILRQESRRQLDLPAGALIYLFVGRLQKLKRIDLLLEAWAQTRLRSLSRLLVVVGDGPERDALRNLAAHLNLCDVRFLPPVDDVKPILAAADVFVLPSSREGMSMALLEAMAAGLAVVVSDLPGNRCVVTHKVDGIVSPVGSVDSLAAALVECENAGLRARLGDAAAVKVQRRFSLSAMALQHWRMYVGEALLAEGLASSVASLPEESIHAN